MALPYSEMEVEQYLDAHPSVGDMEASEEEGKVEEPIHWGPAPTSDDPGLGFTAACSRSLESRLSPDVFASGPGPKAAAVYKHPSAPRALAGCWISTAVRPATASHVRLLVYVHNVDTGSLFITARIGGDDKAASQQLRRLEKGGRDWGMCLLRPLSAIGATLCLRLTAGEKLTLVKSRIINHGGVAKCRCHWENTLHDLGEPRLLLDAFRVGEVLVFEM